MQIKTNICYNMELLCFLNIMTADKYYVNFHKAMFDKFYPKITGKTKRNIQAMIKGQGYTMLSPALTLLISSLSNFSGRSLTEMLNNRNEIESSMSKTPYTFSHEDYDFYFSHFRNAVIPLIEELEAAGIHDFWLTDRLPKIRHKCDEMDAFLHQFNVEKLINRYKNIDNSDFTVYLCSFAKPHGIKLCGNNIISDSSYTNETILSNVTHEVFHPAFNFETVKQHLNVLAEKSWVKEAYKNQNPNSGYYTIDGFIEEHIVEALGIYVLVNLGINIDPIEYFKIHDEGSHVISPHFYRFLCANEKESSQPFEEYFIQFVETFTE